jgi:iron complex outermembrane receptor protein
VPGVTITETFFGYTTISFRGIQETHYNNRTLLLVNGHPIRDVVVGTHWLEAVPASVIERIEIIRGPGSVMYGTGAFDGVISIVTKSGKTGGEASAGGGSKTTVDGSAHYSGNLAHVDYTVAGSYHNSHGYNATVRDETGLIQQMGAYPQDTRAYQDNYYNAFGSVGYAGAKLDLYYLYQDKDKFGLTPVHLTAGNANNQAAGASLSYQATVGIADLDGKAYFDQNAYKSYLNLFPANASGTPIEPRYSGLKSGIGLDARLKLLETLSWFSGLSYEYEKANPYEFVNLTTNGVGPFSPFMREYTTDDRSAFTQLEYAPWPVLKVIGGVRYNYDRDYGSNYVPRASLVYQPLDKLFIKVLYGSAYRNPTFFEKYVNTRNVLYGDPNLKPEKIDTLELGADWSIEKQMVRLAAFRLTTNDMIGRVVTYRAGDVPAVTQLEDRGTPTTPTGVTPGYGNTQGQTIQGVELEVKGNAGVDWLNYQANVSYKGGVQNSDNSSIQFLDKVGANAGLTGTYAAWTACLSANYVGERQGNLDPTTVAPGLTRGAAVKVPAYTLANLKVTYRVLEPLEVSLTVMNLFGQTVLYPEYVRRRIESIPGDSGRNVFGQATYRF